MLPTLTLSVAVLAFVLAIVALFIALLALGSVVKFGQAGETQRADVLALQAHRVRIDQNIASLARHIASTSTSIVVPTPPGRPQ